MTYQPLQSEDATLKTAMTPEQRHEDVVRRYPGGLTPSQFRCEVLSSADEDGKLDPPALADWFKRESLLIGMWMDGLIERRCRRDESGPWFISDKGRAAASLSDQVGRTQ